MALNIIDQLVKAKKPKQRIDIVMRQHQKNIAYFKQQHRELGEVLEEVKTGPFHIEMTDDFLNIIDTRSGQYCHPPNQLLDYVRKLGHWHHDRWVDKLEVLHAVVHGTEHGDRQRHFLNEIHEHLPFISRYMAEGEVRLPRLKNGLRYSGATAFVGIFTGLHIAHYLSHTQVRDLILIEPDIFNFCLSSFFLDYEEIQKKNKRLVLHVGEDLPEAQLAHLIEESPITARAWLRVLPAYPAPEFERIIERLHLRWRALTEIVVPFDREVRNLQHGLRNLRAGLPLLHDKPTLSPNSRIAVVASGPSLNQELDWLKANQDRLIIVAVHSSVRILKQHGIRPDFQCTLDTELNDELLDKLDMYLDVPLVAYYKASETMLARFQDVLMINEYYKSDPVSFKFSLAYTHPTSGNVATAFAVVAEPAQLYLLGLDLGFRDTRQAHAKGYWQGEADSVHGTLQSVQVPANFAESEGQIFTHAYLNSARMAVEGALANLNTTKVSNLADGVRIQGAEPCRGETLSLSDYPEKAADIEAIRAAFSAGAEDKFWIPYTAKGQDMLDKLRKHLVEELACKRFDWPAFSKSLDHAWKNASLRWYAEQPTDKRIETYHLFVQHLLSDWYRAVLLSRSPTETEAAYRTGLQSVEATLAELRWPEELDIDE